MKIIVGNVYSKIEGIYPKDMVYDFLTRSYVTFTRRKGMPPTREVKYFTFLQVKNNTFHSGFSGMLYFFLKRRRIDVIVEDKRTRPEKQFEFSVTDEFPELRYYQSDAVGKALNSTRGIIVAPTGSGKTCVMAELIRKIGVKTLVMVPNLVILDTLYDKFSSWFDVEIGKIGDKSFQIEPPIIIATAQSLWSLYKRNNNLFNQFKMLVGEEFHHLAMNKFWQGNTWFHIANKLTNAYYRFGFTATVGHENDINRAFLTAATGKVIHYTSVAELVGKGYLCPVRVKVYPIVISGEHCDIWQEAYKKGITSNERRNRFIAKICKDNELQGLNTLVVVNRIEDHGMVLKELMPFAVFLNGRDSSDVRKDIIEKFTQGKIKTLISTVMNEGVDIHGIDCVVLAAGGKSKKQLLQRIGRAMRVREGKEWATIVDFFDDDAGILRSHSRQRMKVYKENGFEVEVEHEQK